MHRLPEPTDKLPWPDRRAGSLGRAQLEARQGKDRHEPSSHRPEICLEGRNLTVPGSGR